MAPFKATPSKLPVVPVGVCDGSEEVVAPAPHGPVTNLMAFLPNNKNPRTHQSYKENAQDAIDTTNEILAIKMPRKKYCSKSDVDKSGTLLGSMVTVSVGIIAYTLVVLGCGQRTWKALQALGLLDQMRVSADKKERSIYHGFLGPTVDHLFDKVVPMNSHIKKLAVLAYKRHNLWKYCIKSG